MAMIGRWTCRHFAQSTSEGVPALLRRVADSVESLGEVSVQDITYQAEITEDGDTRHTMTVYFHEGEGADSSDAG